MNRRALLKTIGGSAAVGLAGCLTRRSSRGTEQPNDTTSTPEETDNDTPAETDNTPTETDNDTSTETDGGCPDLVDSSFEVVSAECGAGETQSSASFESNSIHVSGTIDGANTCYTATLDRVRCEEETVTVSVQSYESENDDICSMCVTDIEYEATLDFENDLPQRIVVVHDGSDVLNESRK